MRLITLTPRIKSNHNHCCVLQIEYYHYHIMMLSIGDPLLTFTHKNSYIDFRYLLKHVLLIISDNLILFEHINKSRFK